MTDVITIEQDQKIYPGFKQSKEFDQKIVEMMMKIDLLNEMFEFVGNSEDQNSLKLSPCAVWGLVELMKEMNDILFKVHCAQVFIEPPEGVSQYLKDHPSIAN